MHDPRPDHLPFVRRARLTLWILARSLRTRRVPNALAVVAVFIGVGLSLLVPMSASAFEGGVVEASQIFDLLVTSEGSATQAVLNAIYYQERPLSNMEYRVYEALRNEPSTVRAVPLGFGDSFQGHPIVGTTPEYFELRPKRDGPPYFVFAEGGPFSGRYQAVLGSEVAAAWGMSVGDEFEAAHGLGQAFEEQTHAHHYRVVGILADTGDPADRAVFTDIDTVWHAHGQFAPEDGTVDAEHACMHVEGSGEQVEASASGFSPPLLERDHTLYDVALAEGDGGAYGGVLVLSVEATGTWALFATQEGSLVLRDGTGERVAPELVAGPDEVLGCPELVAAQVFYLAEATRYELELHAMPAGQVGLLMEQMEDPDAHDHGEGEHEDHDHGEDEPDGHEDGHDEHEHEEHEEDHEDGAVAVFEGDGPARGATLEALAAGVPPERPDNRGVTAVLWAPESLNDVYRVAAVLDQQVAGVQAIFPGAQIERLSMAIGQGRDIYGALANVILVLAIITVGLNTYVNALQAQRSLAILRAVGVRQGVVASSVLLEATLLAILGVALGVAAAWGGTVLVGEVVADRLSIGFTAPQLTLADTFRAVLLIPVAAGFALLPALRAARRSPLERLR